MINDARLPIKEIYWDGIFIFIDRLQHILRLGSPLLVAGGATYMALTLFDELPAVVGHSNFSMIFSLLPIVAGSLLAAVGCHRVYLMDPESVSNTPAFRWGWRETRFAIWSAMIVIPAILLASLISFLALPAPFLPAWLVVELPLYYVFARLSLVLPAIATDQGTKTLFWSWNLSAGNGWRLALIVGGFPLLLDLLFDTLPASDYAIINFVGWISYVIVGLLEVGLLSLCYSHLIQTRKP